MIDHTGFSVINLEDSKLFYTSVLASLGHIIRLEFPGKAVGFGPAQLDGGVDPGGAFWLTLGTPPRPGCILPSVQKIKRKWRHSTAPPSGLVEKIMVHRGTGPIITLDITLRLSLILMGTI